MNEREQNKAKKTDQLFHHCLYFTANALARTITRVAEEIFRTAGVSPSHAFLLMGVYEEPGIGPKALAEKLLLAPSTVTRLADTLIFKGFLRKEAQGKTMNLFLTEKGSELLPTIEAAWRKLHMAYVDVLGAEKGDRLALEIDKAAMALEKTVK